MKVLLEADKKIKSICGIGKTQNSAVYRLLTYTFSSDVEDGRLIHNSVTGELILFDNDEIKNLDTLPCLYAPWMDELIKKRFLVPESSNDAENVNAIRRVLYIVNQSKDITGYTVLPTTFCNARCFYCYECDVAHETMSMETARKVVDFIDANHGGKPIEFSWFGGEPLLGIKQIDYITKALEERNIQYTSRMISNGYLFDKEIAKRAKELWKLWEIQITLDGTEEIYNKTKAYVNSSESPFNRVINNIGYLLENEIEVHIRLNLGTHNAEDLFTLVKDLCDRFPNKKNLMIYPGILYNGEGFVPPEFSSEDDEMLFNTKQKLKQLIRECGYDFKPYIPTLKNNSCTGNTPTSVMILPSGKLGKCIHFLSDHYIGDLDTGIINKEEATFFEKLEHRDFCAECPIYPFCINNKNCPVSDICDEKKAKQRRESLKVQLSNFYYDFFKKDNINGE